MQTLQIPDQFKDAIVTLLELSDEQFEALNTALTDARPAVFSGWLVTPQIAEELRIDLEQLGRLVETVITLKHMSARNLSAADVSRAVAADAVEKKLGGLSEPGPDSEKLGLRLERLLAVPTIEVSAKARPLYLADREQLVSTRIITDLRPVFSESEAGGLQPAAAVITHSFMVRTLGPFADRKTETVHQIALDFDNLNQLKDEIQRALAKEAALRAWMRGAGLLSVKTSDDED